jgi:metallo-beta-lactamase family protein
VRIHGEDIEILAEVSNLSMLSAHADADEIVRWLRNFHRPPRLTFITHGEPLAAEALKLSIEGELGWHCRVPSHLETFTA